MHVLQPKHTKLKDKEVEKILNGLNISLAQLPKIRLSDPALPPDCELGDVAKIEIDDEEAKQVTYRVVII